MEAKRVGPPPPVVFPGDEPFWEGTARGQCMAKRCTACGSAHFYPRSHCPRCGSRETEWFALSGTGVVYSYTIVPRSPRPLAPVIIDTPEGLRLHSVVTDADVQALRIDDPVVFRGMPTPEGTVLPAFTTLKAEEARAYTQHALSLLEQDAPPVPLLASGEESPDAALQAAVIGAGHMGSGIAQALLSAGFHVHLIDAQEASAQSGAQRIRQALERDLQKGRLTQEQHRELGERLQVGTDWTALRQCSLVVEAVWEDLALKREVFAQIDRWAAPHALLATNTSTLDVAQIAAATARPDRVVGLHFFNPAPVMRLIEVVRSSTTGMLAVQQARWVAQRLGKVAVVVGVCDGFVGNRLMIARERQAGRLLLEGALPDQIDRVLRAFGLPMGTFELQDMAGGIALMFRARQRQGLRDHIIEGLHARGRLGLSMGKGFYRYEAGKRRPLPDPEVTQLIEEASRLEGIQRRTIDDDEVRDRLILPMVNEGAKLLAEGIAQRASDIDLIWQNGYGWPSWKGGPMHYAHVRGLRDVVDRLRQLEVHHGPVFSPAPLLTRLAEAGESWIPPLPKA